VYCERKAGRVITVEWVRSWVRGRSAGSLCGVGRNGRAGEVCGTSAGKRGMKRSAARACGGSRQGAAVGGWVVGGRVVHGSRRVLILRPATADTPYGFETDVNQFTLWEGVMRQRCGAKPRERNLWAVSPIPPHNSS
jgi:hypothetical protein